MAFTSHPVPFIHYCMQSWIILVLLQSWDIYSAWRIHGVKIHIFLPSLFYWQFSQFSVVTHDRSRLVRDTQRRIYWKILYLWKGIASEIKKGYALNNISPWKILNVGMNVQILPRNLMRSQSCCISYLQISSDFGYIWY